MAHDDLDLLGRELGAYLDDRWPHRFAVLGELSPFGDGHSGFTYALGLAEHGVEHAVVLRVAPPGTGNTGPADVGRQGRIMHALGATAVPVPRLFAWDSGPALGGRSFALMARVDGVGWADALRTRPAGDVATQAVAVLHAVREVPVVQTGLGPADATTAAAELARWHRLAQRAPDWLREPAAELESLLRKGIPEHTGPVCLVHGDFHFDNLLFGADGVVAVLDWEIATLCHPALDLASLLVAVLRRRYPADPNPTGGLDIDPLLLVEAWGDAPADLAWFTALTCFKYAAILGYNLGLHRRGKRQDPIYERLTPTMKGLLADGTSILADGLASITSAAAAPRA